MDVDDEPNPLPLPWRCRRHGWRICTPVLQDLAPAVVAWPATAARALAGLRDLLLPPS